MRKSKRMRRWAGGALGVLMAAGITSALSGEPVGHGWQEKAKGWEQFNLDVVRMPPQVTPPAPGDTDWPFYNRTIDGDRYSTLSTIRAENIGSLKEVCRVRIAGPGPFSAGTILANGMLYTTSAEATLAIEPTNCDIVWKSIYNFDEPEIYNANRGVALWENKLFRGTGDGRVVAYDAMTGRELWRVTATDHTRAEYISAAPLAWNGMVFIGTAAGDLGIQGRVMAFDANTGKKLWTFHTVPPPGEFGNETWPGDTWKTGGGGTWSSYTLDPETGELFVPVANPAPAFDPHIRKGDNLFTNSALVLDAKSGRYLWHYQARPNDNHDYGVTPPGILVDVGGRKLLAQASKDGYVYMVDRKSRKLVWKAPVTTIHNFNADATEKGIRICPGAMGGVEYNSPGYDPERGLLVVGSVDWCYRLSRIDYPPYRPGSPYMGGKMDRADPEGTGWITALDARSGKLRWRYKTPAPVIAAVTPTAGGVTFAGDAAGQLYAFRSEDGQLLRKIDTGGAIAGGIITYQIRGRQYLAVGSGNISRSSWGAVTGTPTMIIYSVPESAGGAESAASLSGDIVHGKTVYRASCASCHGANGQGGAGPALGGLSARYTHEQAVAFLKDPPPLMPRLYPGTLDDKDIADVAAFIRTFPEN